MLLSNPFKPDPRVYEEAKALVDAGHRVTILAWDREVRFPERETVDGIDVVRIGVRGGYGKLSSFLPGLVKFYRRARKIAKAIEFDVVHAHDFDTLLLGLLIARRRRAILIYDMHDDYASMISESVPSALAKLVDILQKALVRFADSVIYANDALRDLLGIEGAVVMNCKDPEDYSVDTNALREKLGVGGFTIVYIGILRQINFLRTLINAVKRSEGTYLIIGGDGPHREEVLRLIAGEERIKYIGWVKRDDIPKYTKIADAVVVLNDPGKRYDRLSTPVKMFEAMAAEVPVIVSKGTEAERIVKKCNCGIAVEFGSVDALLRGFEELKDPKTRGELGRNGLKCVEQEYNRKSQMARLLETYDNLSVYINKK